MKQEGITEDESKVEIETRHIAVYYFACTINFFDKIRQDKARQGKAREDKTKQDKTRQDKKLKDKVSIKVKKRVIAKINIKINLTNP